KGKGKATNTEDADAGGREIPHSKRSGYLSKAALEEIRAFAKNVKTTAEELGQQHADRNAINNLITKEYNSLMKDVPKDDLAARREKLKLVYEWSENSSAIPTNRSVKSIAVRVANVKTQFSGLAEAWSNLEDIEIVGAVMYVGQDPEGHQTSGIFGGSDVVREFINAKAIDAGSLRQLVVPYLQRKLGHLYDGQTDDKEEQDSLDDAPEIEIKCWNQDIINTLDANPLKGEVPLVKATDGTILRKISD
ncbi:hypothetical protein PISMIDRAFT_78192, partial [Pisolithus microcarpus 441]